MSFTVNYFSRSVELYIDVVNVQNVLYNFF